MPPSAFEPITEGTLGALLRTLAERRRDAEALVYPAFAHDGVAIRHTYGELDAYVDRLAKGLVALGIEPGDPVALWATNVPDWVPLEFALARIGAILVTVNTSLQRDEVAYVLRQSGAVAVLHGTRNGSTESSAILDELLGGAEAGLPRLRERVWLPAGPNDAPPDGRSPTDGGEVRRLQSLNDAVEQGRRVSDEALAAREAATRPTDVVNIQYTSGTTGFPKGVMLSHRNIVTSGFALGDQNRTTSDDRVVLMVPLFHCFGCVVAVLGTFTHGATLCCLTGFDPGQALRLVHEERCTIIHGVPTMYGAMLAHPDLEQRDTSSLRAGLAAGAPCPEPLMQAIEERLHCDGISVAYGLTEASPGVSGSHPEDPFDARCSTIGRPLPGVEVQVTDPASGNPVPDGHEGELWVRGDNVMVGYNDDDEATARAITPDRWLRTGDLAMVGDDRNLRIVGRMKDIIIRGGENIAPAEIENVLREHPDIVDAAVVGVPDPHFGEEVAAALILRPDASLDEPAYAALLDGRVAAFKVPKIWRTFTQFPLTGSGKVQKFKLRELIAER